MNSKKIVIGFLLGVAVFSASTIESIPSKDQVIQWCKDTYYKARPALCHGIQREQFFAFLTNKPALSWYGINFASAPVGAAINTALDRLDGRNADKSNTQKFLFNMVYIPLSAAVNASIDTLQDRAIQVLCRKCGISCSAEEVKKMLSPTQILINYNYISPRLEPYLQRKSWNIVNRVTDSTQNNSQQSDVQDSLETQNRPFVIHASNQAV